MNDLRQEYIETERAFDQARERLLSLIKDAGLNEPTHFQWAFVDDGGVLHVRMWDGKTLPNVPGIALLKKAGFDRGVLFESTARKKLFLDPTGAYVDPPAKGFG